MQMAGTWLEHDPEKWNRFSEKDHAPTWYLDHDPIQLIGSWSGATDLLCRLGAVFPQQRILQRAKDQRERHDAEHLEVDPHIRRRVAPDDLVEHGQREKEQRPTQCQFAPTFLGEMKKRIEHHAQERLAEQ